MAGSGFDGGTEEGMGIGVEAEFCDEVICSRWRVSSIALTQSSTSVGELA